MIKKIVVFKFEKNDRIEDLNNIFKDTQIFYLSQFPNSNLSDNFVKEIYFLNVIVWKLN